MSYGRAESSSVPSPSLELLPLCIKQQVLKVPLEEECSLLPRVQKWQDKAPVSPQLDRGAGICYLNVTI